MQTMPTMKKPTAASMASVWFAIALLADTWFRWAAIALACLWIARFVRDVRTEGER